jgi:serine/threonine protein kinase
MLTGEILFDAENIKDLSNKVEKGDYSLPTNLSEEAISFLNGMLQYDPKNRYSIDDLCNHDFLKKSYSEFTKINLDKYAKNIVGSKIKMNTKKSNKEEVGSKKNVNNNINNTDNKEKSELKEELNDNNVNNTKNKEISELKEELNKFKKLVEQLNSTILELLQQLNNKNNYLNEMNELKIKINQKEEELNKLKESLKNSNNNKNQINKNKEKCVNFISSDKKVCFAIPCSGDSIFAEIEELLYREYPEYRETNTVNFYLFQLSNESILKNYILILK